MSINYENYQNKQLNCERCKTKLAIYKCDRCEIKNFCTDCDNFVHLNSKSTHNREVIQTYSFQNPDITTKTKSYLVDKDKERNYNYNSVSGAGTGIGKVYEPTKYQTLPLNANTNKYLNSDYDKENKVYNNNNNNNLNTTSNEGIEKSYNELPNYGSPYQTLSFNNKDQDNKYNYNSNYNSNTNINYNSNNSSNQSNYNNNYSSEKLNYNKSHININDSVNRGYINTTHTNNNVINSSLINNSLVGNNTKDYLNEVKNLYEKEKDELLSKISTLQMTLDQVRSSLSEKVSSLEFKLEKVTKENSLNCKIMEDEQKLKVRRILNDKDSEIKNYYFITEDLEKINKELMAKMNESQKNTEEVKNYYKGVINDMELKYKIKEKEYSELKISYDNKLNFCTSNFEEEKDNLIKSYEANYEKLAIAHKESKEKLNSIIYQREVDYKNLMDKYKDDDKKTHYIVNDLRTELNHKVNDNDNLKIKINNMQDEIDKLHTIVGKGKKDNIFVINEIKSYEVENKKLVQENQELKINIEKLNGIIFGKMKSKPNASSSSKGLNKTNATADFSLKSK